MATTKATPIETNLNWLYRTDPAFRPIVVDAAAAAIGSTSTEFAEEWLALEYREEKSDFEGLEGQHADADDDVDIRERLEAKNKALADRVDYWQTAWKDACAERDVYRELCGKLRKAAQDMAAWEVDE